MSSIWTLCAQDTLIVATAWWDIAVEIMEVLAAKTEPRLAQSLRFRNPLAHITYGVYLQKSIICVYIYTHMYVLCTYIYIYAYIYICICMFVYVCLFIWCDISNMIAGELESAHFGACVGPHSTTAGILSRSLSCPKASVEKKLARWAACAADFI